MSKVITALAPEVKVTIEVDIDYAPTAKKQFDDWAKIQGFDVLGDGGRRAWCSEFSSYFRGALGVATTRSGERFLIYSEDIGN